MLSLLLVLACGQATVPASLFPRGCRDRSCILPGAGRGGASAPDLTPQFQLASSSGAGMGTACACTTPTGTNGETLTWAGRASPATCLKTVGAAPQLIANGDMVQCAANQMRVMAGTSGTSVVGPLLEPAATSLLKFPKSFNNAVWNVAASGVANPTITADQATGPDGTLTADRVQIPATTVAGSKYSFVYQASTATAIPGSGLVFFRGCETLYDAGCRLVPTGFKEDGGTAAGTIGLALFGNGGWHDADCPYVSTGWTLCPNENVGIIGAGVVDMGFGNFSGLAVSGGVDRSAQDVFAFGADLKQEAAASSYIDSLDGGPQTRAADAIPYATLSSPISGTASIAASFVAPVLGHGLGDGLLGLSVSPTPDGGPGIGVQYDATSVTSAPYSAVVPSILGCYRQAGDIPTYTEDTLGLGGTQPVVGRIWCANPGATPTQFFNGQLTGFYPTAVRGFTLAPSTIVTIGGWSTLAPPLGGVITNVCVDPRPGICAGGILPATKIAWDGDSIVYGFPSPTRSPAVQLSQLLGAQGRVVTDNGTNGDRALDCSAIFTSRIQGQGYATLIWSCAVNDMAQDATGATTAGQVETALALALADGEKVIVTGIMPWKNSSSWTAGRQTETDSYNTLISAWAAGHGATFVSTASMGGQGGDAAVLLSTYDSGDKVHPSPAGQLKLAQLVQAASP